jgi:hypothetical protein
MRGEFGMSAPWSGMGTQEAETVMEERAGTTQIARRQECACDTGS